MSLKVPPLMLLAIACSANALTQIQSNVGILGHTGFSLARQERSRRSSVGIRRAAVRMSGGGGGRGSSSQFSKADFLRKPEVDFLSLQSFRRETVMQYANTNQSEPLRILLYALAAFFFASQPSFRDLMSEPMGAPEEVASYLGSGIALFFFNRERLRRKSQLVRLEREADAGDLEVIVTDRLALGGARRRASLRELRGEKRVVALFGDAPTLRTSLAKAAPYRRRFETSAVVVVAVPIDGSARDEWLPKARVGGGAAMAVAEPASEAAWVDYFTELLRSGSPRDEATEKQRPERGGGAGSGGYLALNFRGRSVSSGSSDDGDAMDGGGGLVNWDELLGAKFPPTEILAATPRTAVALDAATGPSGPSTSSASSEGNAGAAGPSGDVASDEEAGVLAAQAAFYAALTSGDEAAMQACFVPGATAAPEVESVVSAGGRLDPWAFCLKEGNRPAGLAVFDPDATVLEAADSTTRTAAAAASQGETRGGAARYASSTAIEAPAGAGTGTLLAQQRWIRGPDGRWLLELHQTIPYTVGTGAGGLLRCDGRGCVALLANKDTQTSGGLGSLVNSWI